MPQKIAVIGTGYVGLVTGTCFAESGNQVICVDIDEVKLTKLRAGETPIYEPGLEILLERNIRERRISFTNNLRETIINSKIIFLCLPTPPGDDGAADLRYVMKVAEDIGEILNECHNTSQQVGYKIVVNKSTVPVGTADKVRGIILSKCTNAEFDVVSNPEFLREGRAVDDFMRPERVVVGTSSSKAREVMEDLYEPFMRTGNKIYFISERSAEVAKYAANSFVAMRISFMNEMANLCERVGADVDDVRIAIGSDSRIGKKYLFPSVGYGGSCFPKDVQAILKTASDYGMTMEIITSVENVNKRQPIHFVDKILKHYNGDISDKHFAVWGLAFKADTDDTRDSPAFGVIDRLLEKGAKVTAYDPEAFAGTKIRYGDSINYAEGMYNTVQGKSALIILTEWNEFRNPDFDRLREGLIETVIFDGRNLFRTHEIEEKGFTYYSIGRPR